MAIGEGQDIPGRAMLVHHSTGARVASALLPAATPHDDLFWEFRQQTSVRRGPWKLTLRPYESDDNLSEHDVFLADLSSDVGETVNLRHVHPELTAELTAAALAWRAQVAPVYEEQDW